MEHDVFEGVEGKPNTNIDMVLRTVQQNHMQLSIMADTKASILITVSSVALTIALSRLSDAELRPALLTLAGGCLISLLLAVIAVLPKFHPGKRSGSLNLLFFGHFASMTEDEYMSELGRALSQDRDLYRTVIRDIYAQGSFLYRKKYRFLRMAYMALLAAFIGASLVEVYILTR